MIIYRCDPEKNTACRKLGCRDLYPGEGRCSGTRDPKCAQLDGYGNPIVQAVTQEKTERWIREWKPRRETK